MGKIREQEEERYKNKKWAKERSWKKNERKVRRTSIERKTSASESDWVITI